MSQLTALQGETYLETGTRERMLRPVVGNHPLLPLNGPVRVWGSGNASV